MNKIRNLVVYKIFYCVRDCIDSFKKMEQQSMKTKTSSRFCRFACHFYSYFFIILLVAAALYIFHVSISQFPLSNFITRHSVKDNKTSNQTYRTISELYPKLNDAHTYSVRKPLIIEKMKSISGLNISNLSNSSVPFRNSSGDGREKFRNDSHEQRWKIRFIAKSSCIKRSKGGYYLYHVRKAAGTTMRNFLKLSTARHRIPFHETEGRVLNSGLLQVPGLISFISLRFVNNANSTS